MSLALGFLLVVPARLRVMAGVTGVSYAVLIGAGTLTSGWHRPTTSSPPTSSPPPGSLHHSLDHRMARNRTSAPALAARVRRPTACSPGTRGPLTTAAIGGGAAG